MFHAEMGNPGQGACITLGNFDGVHLGHQALISLAESTARAQGLQFTLITFWPHPRSVLPGHKSHMPLTSREERMRLLKTLNVDKIIELPFTLELAELSPEEFVKKYLLPLGMKELVIGHDFTLGKNRAGTCAYLERLGKLWNFSTRQAPAFTLANEPVSSTRLRKAIADGNMELAQAMLGRQYAIQGTVAHGFGRGAGLGFPTANLSHSPVLLPGNGVYAAWALINGNKYKSVTNIGTNPTFGNTDTSVECHLLEGGSDLYGEPIQIEFAKRLRAEQKFASPKELQKQIECDISAARQYLSAPDA